jgi:hypothetical protein
MLTKHLEHLFYMLQVLYPSVAKDKNIIKKYKHNLRMKGLRMSFIRDWNVDGALVRPKGITRNS